MEVIGGGGDDDDDDDRNESPPFASEVRLRLAAMEPTSGVELDALMLSLRTRVGTGVIDEEEEEGNGREK
jgi:hypothetical protein